MGKKYLIVALCIFISAISIKQTTIAQDEASTTSATAELQTESKGGDVANTYKKPSLEELKSKLTPEQFQVTQHEATERPFNNQYWDNKKPGIYVDVVTGEPLFSSLDKYDSGTGWPSFSRALDDNNIVTKEDRSLGFQTRVEVRSKHGDSHLGHLFDDGPSPSGQRFCMNSASMRFVPADRLEEEGYGEYKKLFSKEGAVSKSHLTSSQPHEQSSSAATIKPKEETALLAGGCFWGMEEIIRKIPGVLRTNVGYTGGSVENPVYPDVRTGKTGHAESIEVIFDPSKLSYADLLGYFFRMHNPTTLNQQGNDIGTQYRSAIFYLNDEQKRIAEEEKEKVQKSGKWDKPIVTEITRAGKFYNAEDYHQDYLEKNPGGYTCHFLRD